MTHPKAFTIGVVAHESRLERATELVLKLQADALTVDDGTLGCAGNHIQILQQLGLKKR